MTPLHLAAMGGHLEVARALLAAGAEMEARDKVRDQGRGLGGVEGPRMSSLS